MCKLRRGGRAYGGRPARDLVDRSVIIAAAPLRWPLVTGRMLSRRFPLDKCPKKGKKAGAGEPRNGNGPRDQTGAANLGGGLLPEEALGTQMSRKRRLDGDIRVPAKSTIHAVLDRHGLVKRGGGPRHRARGTPLSQGRLPNDLWCADFKGEFKLGNGRYRYPLTVTDHTHASCLPTRPRRSRTAAFISRISTAHFYFATVAPPPNMVLASPTPLKRAGCGSTSPAPM